MDLLILLVEGRRQLVSRNEIVDRLWGKDVFVDVDTGVNTTISKIRQVLRDSPDAPAFVETVPGKGYRFIAPVETVSLAAEPVAGVRQPERQVVPNNGCPRSEHLAQHRLGLRLLSSRRPSGHLGLRPGLRSRLGVGFLILAVVVRILAFTD